MLLSVHSKQRSNTGLGRASQAHSQASNASLSPDKNNQGKRQGSPPKRAQSQVFAFKKNLRSNILKQVQAKLSQQDPSAVADSDVPTKRVSGVNVGIFLNPALNLTLNQGTSPGEIVNSSSNLQAKIKEEKEEDEEENDSLTEEGNSRSGMAQISKGTA